MTIHKLLEKVDLLNFIFDDDGDGSNGTEKPKTVVKNNNDPTSAYLGKYCVIYYDNSPVSDSDLNNSQISGPRNIFSNPITLEDLMDDDSDMGGEMVNLNDVLESVSPRSPEVITRPSIIVPVKSKSLNYFCSNTLKYFSPPEENVKLEPNLQKGGNGFLYVESKRARLEREKVGQPFSF